MRIIKFKLSYLSILLTTLVLNANDSSNGLDDLLSQYRSESDLSKQTKKESAGSVFVYTRDQLEKMQAYNLRDILKIIPVFTMQESYSGQVSLAKAKGSTFNSQFLKLYINDHEVGSIGFGSAMKMWGYLDISYIDHIEVYQVGSSVMAGDEPPGIVVRLYSKDPKHDDGGALLAMGGSRGSNELNGYYAYKGETYSALFYADTHTENRKNYNAIRSPSGTFVDADRDFQTTNLFASLQGEDFTIDAAQFTLDQDRLLGFGKLRTPLENTADMLHRYLVATKYFQDKTLKVKLAYDDANHQQAESDPNGIVIYNVNGTSSPNVKSWYFDKSESILDAVMDKQLILDNHDIHAGIQTKIKKVIPNSLTVDGVERVNEISGPTKWTIYSAFVSDNLTLNEYNLIFADYKLDHYKRNGGADDVSDYVLRLGHIYNDGTWMWKTFGTRTYGYPVFMQTTNFPFISKSDIELKNEERMALSTEVTYHTNSSDTTVRLLYNNAKNAIVLEQNQYVNSDVKPDFYSLYAGHEIRFDHDHRLVISGYYGNDDMPMTQSSTTGGLIQLFNTFNQFDLYNEIVYRKGYTFSTKSTSPQSVQVDSGYDYTAAVTYHATKDLSVFLKGENLLNKAIKTPYPASTYVDYIVPFDRTVRAGLKYVF